MISSYIVVHQAARTLDQKWLEIITWVTASPTSISYQREPYIWNEVIVQRQTTWACPLTKHHTNSSSITPVPLIATNHRRARINSMRSRWRTTRTIMDLAFASRETKPPVAVCSFRRWKSARPLTKMACELATRFWRSTVNRSHRWIMRRRWRNVRKYWRRKSSARWRFARRNCQRWNITASMSRSSITIRAMKSFTFRFRWRMRCTQQPIPVQFIPPRRRKSAAFGSIDTAVQCRRHTNTVTDATIKWIEWDESTCSLNTASHSA